MAENIVKKFCNQTTVILPLSGDTQTGIVIIFVHFWQKLFVSVVVVLFLSRWSFLHFHCLRSKSMKQILWALGGVAISYSEQTLSYRRSISIILLFKNKFFSHVKHPVCFVKKSWKTGLLFYIVCFL